MVSKNKRFVLVSLACNHYRNGMFKGYAEQVECCGIHLASPYADAYLKCDVDPKHVRLGARRWWQAFGVVTWYGNWCWDAAWMKVADAAELMTFARGKGYRPDSAPEQLFDNERFTAADLLLAATET